jgi:hypothetical protein
MYPLLRETVQLSVLKPWIMLLDACRLFHEFSYQRIFGIYNTLLLIIRLILRWQAGARSNRSFNTVSALQAAVRTTIGCAWMPGLYCLESVLRTESRMDDDETRTLSKQTFSE